MFSCSPKNRRQVISPEMLSCSPKNRRQVISPEMLSCSPKNRRQMISPEMLSCSPKNRRQMISPEMFSCFPKNRRQVISPETFSCSHSARPGFWLSQSFQRFGKVSQNTSRSSGRERTSSGRRQAFMLLRFHQPTHFSSTCRHQRFLRTPYNGHSDGTRCGTVS